MLSRKSLLVPFCLLLAACADAPTAQDIAMTDALCAQGKQLLAAHKYDEARDIYASATRRDEHNPRAWNGLGVADELLGKRAAAEKDYQAALDLSPHDPIAANNLAHLYIASGRAQQAVDLLQPYSGDPTAATALRQNYAAALRAAAADKQTGAPPYAEIGSYPTEGMAQGRLGEISAALNDRDIHLRVVSDVKVSGGFPSFAIQADGKPAAEICEKLLAQAYPCLPVAP